MLSTEPYSRRKSSTDELEKSLTQYQSKIFDNEQHSRKPVKTLNGKQNQHEKSRAKNHNRSILKRHNQNELAHGDFIQRAIREGLASGKQRKTSNTSSTNNSYDLNEIFEDENNDWFFEKLLDKFESIRGKTIHEYVESASDDVNNSVTYGPERIIERRYYINKAASLSKRNQLTSTTDLTKYREKTRLISRVSSLTAATTYSRGSTSTPVFLENLHQQSDLLRHGINDLRNDIEQLQTSQDQFFQQMKSQFQSNTNTTATSQSFVQPAVLSGQLLPENKQSPNRTVIPSSNSQRARSVSTASVAPSAASSSEYSDLTLKIANKANVAPLGKPVVPAQPISQFIATKNSAISPTPLVKERLNSKASSTTPSLRISEFIATKNAFLAPSPPLNSEVTPKPASVTPFVPPKNQSNSFVSDQNSRSDSKSSSTAPTPTNTKVIARKPSSTESESESSVDIPAGPANTKPTSISRTPPVNSNITSKSPSIAPTLPAVPSTASKSQTNLPTLYQNPCNDSESSSVASTPTNTKVAARKPSSTESESSVTIPAGPANTKPTSISRTPSVNSNITSKSPSVISTLPAVPSVASKNETNLPTSYQNPCSVSGSLSAASTPTNIKLVARKSSSTESESELLAVIPTGPLNTKPPSAPRTPLANNSFVSKSPSITAAQPLNTNVTARSPSIELAPSMTQFIAPKNRSTGSTGSAVLPVVISSPIAPSSIPSAPIPIYENELAYRHALSPRSQIVASSTPVHESSGSSDGSTSPEFVSSVPAKAPTVPRTTLQDNELKALAHYSSQLELSGFTPSVNPVIANPNFSTTFWDSVDHFIANNKATNSVTRLPPVSRPIDRSGYRWNNSVNKVLDKYNLEIKPQEIIESSAPLLMPPLDSLP
ncbi:unnamed protein product [Rotaria socialis]|uniref:Uncharacterized protein n=1 Tax=Rotaria socialis TaxID=392032 RepID=A0A820PPA1_9BILA|nr:unnamed protein product [Rotaria socialis]CAF4407502.1 unnamed protein product [Rotaria socialis]